MAALILVGFGGSAFLRDYAVNAIRYVLAVAFTGVLFFFEFRKALRAMPKSEKKS